MHHGIQGTTAPITLNARIAAQASASSSSSMQAADPALAALMRSIEQWAEQHPGSVPVAEQLLTHLRERPDSHRLQLQIPADGELPPLEQLNALTQVTVELCPAGQRRDLHTASQLRSLQNVRSLALTNGSFATPESWNVLWDLKQLRALDLSRCDLSTPAPTWFNQENFHHLTSIALPAAAVAPGGAFAQQLRQLPGVQNVSLHGALIEPTTLPHTLGVLPGLRQLELHECRLDKFPNLTSADFPSLRHIIISGAHFSNVPLGLIRLNADICLINSGFIAPGVMEAGQFARAAHKADGLINSAFATRPIYSREHVAMGARIREKWVEIDAPTLAHSDRATRLPPALQRLHDRVCQHMTRSELLARQRGSDAVFTRHVGAVEARSLKMSLADFERVHPSRVAELIGDDRSVAIARTILQQLVEELAASALADMHSVFGEVADADPQACAFTAGDPEVPLHVSAAIDWSVARPTAISQAGSEGKHAMPLSSQRASSPSDFEEMDPLEDFINEVLAWEGGQEEEQELTAVDQQERQRNGERLISFANDPSYRLALDADPVRSTGLPGAMCLLPTVTDLKINLLDRMPPIIGSMQQLRELHVTSNEFTTADWEVLQSLTRLRQLTLEVPIASVPDWLNKENFPDLNVLVLGKSELTTLPPFLCTLDGTIELHGGALRETSSSAATSGLTLLHRNGVHAVQRAMEYDVRSLVRRAWEAVAGTDAGPLGRRGAFPVEMLNVQDAVTRNALVSMQKAQQSGTNLSDADVMAACLARAIYVTQTEFENVFPIEQELLSDSGSRIDLQRETLKKMTNEIADNDFTEMSNLFGHSLPTSSVMEHLDQTSSLASMFDAGYESDDADLQRALAMSRETARQEQGARAAQMHIGASSSSSSSSSFLPSAFNLASMEVSDDDNDSDTELREVMALSRRLAHQENDDERKVSSTQSSSSSSSRAPTDLSRGANAGAKRSREDGSGG